MGFARAQPILRTVAVSRSCDRRDAAAEARIKGIEARIQSYDDI